VTFIPDVGGLNPRLEGMGLVLLSESLLDGKVHIATYSIPAEKAFSKRNTTLEKRDQKDIQGANCMTTCGNDAVTPPNSDHCVVVYKTLYTNAVQFTTKARASHLSKYLRDTIPD
jgi:phosphatidylethanolamine-binding protein (PEBP) family uncharacterized protein